MYSAPLLALTALGLIGVYLLLPRQRPSLVALGALVGSLALAGFFLFLVRQAATPADAPSIFFYLFAGIMIIGAIGVICHPRPVYAALYFVLVTLAGAALFVMLLAEFMAVVLIIVYAGAILVTYVFVIMLASQGKRSPEYDRIAAEPFVAVLTSFVLLGAVLLVMFPDSGRPIALAAHPDARMIAATAPATLPAAATQTALTSPDTQPATQMAATTPPAAPKLSNVQLLGLTLYGSYALSLEIAGILLTIALVGAVVIARKNAEGIPTTDSNLPPE